ncbi:MAG TPA: hypothetical protein VH678_18865 [Xanthobacteraceae bacterium]|jgi:hypothetical protein
MKKICQRAVLALHVTFAFVSIMLLALDMVKAEAALTNGSMLPLTFTSGSVGSP